MWKVIYFSCTLRRLHILCQHCPPCLVIFQNYPFCSFFFVLSYPPLPLPPSLVKPTGTLPASSLAATTLFFLLLHTLHKSSPLSPLSICLQYSKPTWNPGVFWYLDNVECHPKPFRGLCFFQDFWILFFQLWLFLGFGFGCSCVVVDGGGEVGM